MSTGSPFVANGSACVPFDIDLRVTDPTFASRRYEIRLMHFIIVIWWEVTERAEKNAWINLNTSNGLRILRLAFIWATTKQFLLQFISHVAQHVDKIIIDQILMSVAVAGIMYDKPTRGGEKNNFRAERGDDNERGQIRWKRRNDIKSKIDEKNVWILCWRWVNQLLMDSLMTPSLLLRSPIDFHLVFLDSPQPASLI